MRFSQQRCLGRAAFTLLEIILAIAIAVMVGLMAVPSLTGLMESRDDEERFEQFQSLVYQIREESLRTQRPFEIAFDEEGAIGREGFGDDPAEVERFELGEGETLEVEFPAAMIPPWEKVWAFWPSGFCEPAVVTFRKKDGKGWKVVFDPFTARGDVQFESGL